MGSITAHTELWIGVQVYNLKETSKEKCLNTFAEPRIGLTFYHHEEHMASIYFWQTLLGPIPDVKWFVFHVSYPF